MRSSVSSVTLLEVALVQICQLQDLAAIPAIIDAITRGGPLPSSVAPRAFAPAPTNEKKNVEGLTNGAASETFARSESPAASSFGPTSVAQEIVEQPVASAAFAQHPSSSAEDAGQLAVQPKASQPLASEQSDIEQSSGLATAHASVKVNAAQPTVAAAANPVASTAASTPTQSAPAQTAPAANAATQNPGLQFTQHRTQQHRTQPYKARELRGRSLLIRRPAVRRVQRRAVRLRWRIGVGRLQRSMEC